MSKRMHTAISLAAVSMVVSLGATCGTQTGSGGTANSEPIVKTEPAKAPSDRGDQVVTGGDLAFMNDAAPGGMAEVEMGRLAVKQAASSEVKQFAERMVADHSKAGEELKQLARQKKVMLPQGHQGKESRRINGGEAEATTSDGTSRERAGDNRRL